MMNISLGSANIGHRRRCQWFLLVIILIGAFASPSSAQISNLRDTALETYAARCLEEGDDGALWLAAGQWDSLFAKGYTAAQILQLAHTIPEDCGFLSFEFAIEQLAEEWGVVPGEETAAEADDDSGTATASDRVEDAAPIPTVATAATEPDPTDRVYPNDLDVVDLHEPSGFGAGGRLLGMGTYFGVGYGYNSTLNVIVNSNGVGSHLDIQLPGFEFRVFPTDRVSIDFLFQIGNLAWIKDLSHDDLFILLMFAHIYAVEASVPQGRVGFSIAPGMLAMTNLEYTDIGAFGGGFRVGLDATTSDDVFGFGIYLRPLFYVIKEQYGKNYGNFEMLLEFTWTWYVPRPPGV